MATETSSAPSAPPPPLPTSPSIIYRSLSIYPFDQDPEYLAGLSAILGHPDTPPTHEELTSNPDLILQACCFYFARRNNLPSLNPAAYQQWLSENNPTIAPPTTETLTDETTTTSQSAQPTTTTPSQPPPTATTSAGGPIASEQQQPPYPTSFAAIVDLITRNVPVPGIEEIPDTVLEHGSSKVDHTPRRRKPWESSSDNALPILPVVANGGEAGGAVDGAESGAARTAAAGAQADDASGNEPDARMNDEDSSGKANVNGHLATGEGVVKILQEGAIPDSGLLARD